MKSPQSLARKLSTANAHLEQWKGRRDDAALLVREGGEQVWGAALIDEDVWSCVANTGRFHRNDGLRHDFFMLNEMEYAEIGVSEAGRLIAAGVGTLSEEWQADALDRWRRDGEWLAVEDVFASQIADLA